MPRKANPATGDGGAAGIASSSWNDIPANSRKSPPTQDRRSSRRRQPEAALQRAVVAHLRARPAPDLVWWHTPNGGLRNWTEAAIMTGLGVVAGVPDLLLFRNGSSFALELKAPGGRLSEAQSAMLARLDRAGVFCAVCDDLDRALGVLQSWRLLRGAAQ